MKENIAKILKVLRPMNNKVDLWFLEVEFVGGTIGKTSMNNSAFMGLVLRLRMNNPANVCTIPQVNDDLVNFGR